MSSLAILDDFSPLLGYSSDWLDQSAIYQSSDPALDGYYARTYHTMHREQGYMKVFWEGTGIAIYGTKKSNHGMYSVILDAELDGPKQYFDGYATTDILNSTLFSANNLSPGFHQAIIVNEITRTGISGRTVLGIDAVHIMGKPLDANQPKPVPQQVVQPVQIISSAAPIPSAQVQVEAGPASPIPSPSSSTEQSSSPLTRAATSQSLTSSSTSSSTSTPSSSSSSTSSTTSRAASSSSIPVVLPSASSEPMRSGTPRLKGDRPASNFILESHSEPRGRNTGKLLIFAGIMLSSLLL